MGPYLYGICAHFDTSLCIFRGEPSNFQGVVYLKLIYEILFMVYEIIPT